ncbi:hypothetical protein F4860DRAFT_343095 [Xylaria cubensis]|nr:hypothetical protein F4860DRAFT_343095 [Xylaria cubensis]
MWSTYQSSYSNEEPPLEEFTVNSAAELLKFLLRYSSTNQSRDREVEFGGRIRHNSKRGGRRFPEPFSWLTSKDLHENGGQADDGTHYHQPVRNPPGTILHPRTTMAPYALPTTSGMTCACARDEFIDSVPEFKRKSQALRDRPKHSLQTPGDRAQIPRAQAILCVYKATGPLRCCNTMTWKHF